ncbi:MAG: transcription termination/antitermination protein NusG [bacterium]|nr:transcription termination/antitermination protein NusG [Mycoplasmatota bacterium]MDD6757454.1 transcription termination/antitermination protein NusG [bacterium]MDY2908645.1 transcription termination/antitermination protein NusG [Candidatus Faecimonas sp.]
MDKQWYVVNTYSGHENKVKEKLEMRAESMDMQDYIFRVVIPEEKVIEDKDGVRKEKVKKMFPGYILVEMVMTDEAWYVVRNTPGVTGFIGSSGKGAKPTPLQPYEVDKILGNMGISRMDVDTDLVEGATVKIVDGPFNGMFGKIDSVDVPNQKVMLLVDLFGQETSVEVELNQIQKA